MIPRPTSCGWVSGWNATLLTFPDDASMPKEDRWEPGYYDAAGGICWPVPMTRHGTRSVQGFALVVGRNVETDKFTVFEQQAFVTVEHIFGEGKRIEFAGIAPWFNTQWARYRCRRFFWHDDLTLHERFARQIYRSETIEPKPWLCESPWVDDRTAMRIMWELLATKRLMHRREEQVLNDLADADPKGSVDLETKPALHALCACLCGMEKSPWRKPL